MAKAFWGMISDAYGQYDGACTILVSTFLTVNIWLIVPQLCSARH